MKPEPIWFQPPPPPSRPPAAPGRPAAPPVEVVIDGQRATGLHSIDMERYLPGTADAANFCYWLDGTHLVVGIHDGDEYGLIGDGTPDFVRVYATIAVNR